MRWLFVEAFAVLAAYLILTLPAASASSISIRDPGGSPVGSADYSPWSLLDKDVEVNPPWDDPSVSIRIRNTSQASVEKVVLYRCGNKGPSECVSAFQPYEYPGSMDEEIPWASLAIQSGYPQEGNLLALVRVNDAGKAFWTGYWIGITRSSEQGFALEEKSPGSVVVTLSSTGALSIVKGFILSNRMIPFNPLWVSSIEFEAASSIYSLGFSQATSISGSVMPGNGVGSVASDFTAALADGPGGVWNPIVVYDSPSFVCGDDLCETTEKGENQGNCCLDCECSAGYYCDSSGSCRQESGIGLEIYGTMNPGISNCFETHALIAPVRLVNPPSGFVVESASQRLMGDYRETACEHISGDVYNCVVTVQPIEDCQQGTFMLGPNALSMRISFPDGENTRTMDLVTSLPYITIGSFECGKSGCEPGLGESQDNCCLDCGCFGGYCDYVPGSEPGDAVCRDDPMESGISAVLSPLHFAGLGITNQVRADVTIGGAPSSMSLSEASCSMGCSSELPCASSCSVSCSQQDPGDLSCQISFSVDGYDSLMDYSLSPELTLDVRYSNGTSVVQKTLVKPLNQISVGAHWCGDGVPQEGEASEDCCFDAGCPAGQYCDTQSIGGPTEGDGCRPLSEAELVITDIGDTSFSDSSVKHMVSMNGTVSDPPSGLVISGSCSLADDPWLGCDMVCGLSGGKAECGIEISPIYYLGEGLEYYSANTRTLSIKPNRYSIGLTYNDGGQKRTDYYNSSLGTVSIGVTSHCGEGGCESDLGEDQDSCCRECGCGGFGDDYFCFTGADPNGECVSNSSILLEAAGFSPDPLKCVIGRIGGKCKFVSAVRTKLAVVNPPDDIEVLDSWFTGKGKQESMTCEEVEGENGNFTCAFVPGDLAGTEGFEDIAFEFMMSVGYTIGGAGVVASLTASNVSNVSREKSSALASCEDEISRLQAQISKLEGQRGKYNMYATLMNVIGVALMAAATWCFVKSCGGGPPGEYVTPDIPPPPMMAPLEPSPEPEGLSSEEGPVLSLQACIDVMVCIMLMTTALQAFAMAMGVQQSAQSADAQILGLEAQITSKRQLCSAESFPLASSAVGGMSPLPAF